MKYIPSPHVACILRSSSITCCQAPLIYVLLTRQDTTLHTQREKYQRHQHKRSCFVHRTGAWSPLRYRLGYARYEKYVKTKNKKMPCGYIWRHLYVNTSTETSAFVDYVYRTQTGFSTIALFCASQLQRIGLPACLSIRNCCIIEGIHHCETLLPVLSSPLPAFSETSAASYYTSSTCK